MDQLVQFLFKHEPTVFTKGRLTFDIQPTLALVLVCALLVAALVYFLYGQRDVRVSAAARAALIALRVSFIALLILLLLRPAMVVPQVIARSTYVALLADDSRSMQLMDERSRNSNDGDATSSRVDAIKNALAADNSFMRRLADKFKINLYGFSSATAKLRSAAELQADGANTNLTAALNQTLQASTGRALSGIVIFTDGASNAPGDLAAQLRELRACNIPVYAVGTGDPTGGMDAEMRRVTAPRRVLIGSSVTAEALIRLSGYGQTKVLVAVSEDGRALKTQSFDVRGGETRELTIIFTPATAGDHRYSFTITPLEGELTIENNTQETMVQVVNAQPKVLYMEGEPRWEYGKMRQSLAKNEKNVVLVSVLRSADGKFYRQGVESDQDLLTGFPTTEEELFKYQGLILGSIEANFFNFEQLRMIEQFVARRGGGFLAIGGRNAFDAGKYANTPINDLLPVRLDDRVDLIAASAEPSNIKATLTARGRTHAITRFNEDANANLKAWNELPAVTVTERLSGIKPGATVLLEARGVRDKNLSLPLLTEEHYGRGRSLAFTASDTWRWRMEMPSENTAHETFWRQMLRYLVSTTPNQIEVAAERDLYTAAESVRLRAEVNDAKYEAITDAQVSVLITKPSGVGLTLPLTFKQGEAISNYQAEFTPDEPGLYRIDLTASKGRTSLGAAQSTFVVSEQDREFYDHRQNVDLLKRVAAETGGKYYPLNEADKLIEELVYRDTDNSEQVTKELWDMPINFLLLIGLVSAEWFLRKRKGLA